MGGFLSTENQFFHYLKIKFLMNFLGDFFAEFFVPKKNGRSSFVRSRLTTAPHRS